MPVSPKHKINIPDKAPGWDTNASLGNKLVRAFTIWLQEVATWSTDWIVDVLETAFDRGFKILRPGFLRIFDPVMRQLEDDPHTPPYVKQMFTNIRNEEGEAMIVAGTVAILPALLGILLGIMAPVFRLAEHKVDQAARSGLADPFNLLVMLRRGGLSPQDADKFLSLAGVPNEIIAGYRAAAVNLLDVGPALDAWRRGEYSEQELDGLLKQQGYSERDVAAWKVVGFAQPGIGDLITMLVRDVFSENVVQQYGYDEDYPAQVDALARQIGLADGWAKRFWRAHWNLPSPTQGYEMLHRGFINPQELDDLLRIGDYPPFWRQRLRDISFSPITRVDLRRLYGAGLIDESRVLKGYQDLGYPPADAQALTAFALLGQSETERDLTRADVLGAFEDDIYTEADARSALAKLGYDAAEANLLLARAAQSKAQAVSKEIEAQAKSAYIARQIAEAEAVSRLAGAGYSDAKIKRLLTEWTRTRDARTKTPTQAQMARFWQNDIIGQKEFEDYLKAEGYSDDAIKWIVADAAPEGVEVEERVLTPAQAVSAFIADALAEPELRQRLAESGLADTDIEVTVARALGDKLAKRQRDVKTLTRLQYINLQIDAGQARSALGAVELTSAEQDALLAEWSRTRESRAAQMEEEARRELSKSDAINLFLRNQLSEPDVRASLDAAGYSAEAIDALVAGAKAERAERAAANAIDLARTQYLNDQLDRQGAQNVLVDGGLSAQEVAAKLAEWDRSKELRAVRLTQAGALRLLRDGIIDLTGYVAYLQVLGYTGGELDNLTAQARLILEEE